MRASRAMRLGGRGMGGGTSVAMMSDNGRQEDYRGGEAVGQVRAGVRDPPLDRPQEAGVNSAGDDVKGELTCSCTGPMLN